MFKIKTLIEIFDENQLNNVVAVLRFKPEKAIFVGSASVMTQTRIANIEKLLAMKGLHIETEYCPTDRYDFDKILETLENIIAQHEDCCFDLTGGKELVIAAMGYLSAKHGLPMVQFNIRSGRMQKVTGCENIQEPPKASLTVREIIVLGGGVVLESEPGETHWDFNEDFCRDIRKMWDICREKCGLWNKQCNVFLSFSEWGKTKNLEVEADLEAMKRRGADTMLDSRIIRDLCDSNLLRNYSLKDGVLHFTYKNSQVKNCLTKAGNILELYGFLAAREVNRGEAGYFDDMDIGVHIDWDGDPNSGRSVKNEVDLMLVRDMNPVFVSCKNGEIGKEALYELSTVADEFAGEYAKKLLLATFITHDHESKKHFLQRAAEMDIKVIEGVDEKTLREITNELKNKTI